MTATSGEKKSKFKFYGLSFLLIAILVIGSGMAFQALAKMKPKLAERDVTETIFNVDAFVAEKVDLQEIISGFGTAKCAREVVVSAQVSGLIVEIHPKLKVGASVSSGGEQLEGDATARRDGDLLVRIDPRPFQERVTQATNRLDEIDAEIASTNQQIENNTALLTKARTDYRSFEKEYQRIQKARSKGVSTATELTRSLLELQKYKDSVLQYETQSKLLPLAVDTATKRKLTLKNDLQLAALEFKKTEVRPRFGGRLSDVMVELGQFVRAGEPIARVSDLSLVEVAVPLALSEYSKLEAQIRAGQQPVVELASNETSAPTWTGNLVRVAPEADEETRTVNVFVQVENKLQPAPLLPGTFVNVRIPGPTHSQVIPIPRDSIRKGRVFVVDQEKSKLRDVKVEAVLQTLAILKDSVNSGDQIVLTNLDTIFEDAAIAVQRTRDLDDEMRDQRTELVRIKSNDDASDDN